MSFIFLVLKTCISSLFVFLVLGLGSGAAMAQGVLFVNPSLEIARTAAVVEELSNIKTRKDLTDTTIVDVNLSALESDWISVKLKNDRTIQINLLHISRPASNTMSWVGEVRLGGGEAIFTVVDGKMEGSIRLPGEYFMIGRLKYTDTYVISKSVREMVPPPDPPTGPIKVPFDISDRRIEQFNGISSDESVVVRILVAYTLGAKALLGEKIDASVAAAIQNLNEGLSNSRVKVSAQLAGIYATGYLETGDFNKDLATFRQSTAIKNKRDALAADIVVTLVDSLSFGNELCGVTYLNGGAEYAYAIVSARYLSQYGDCLAHEVGHIFGADHDLANSRSPAFSYGHGVQYVPGAPMPTTQGY